MTFSFVAEKERYSYNYKDNLFSFSFNPRTFQELTIKFGIHFSTLNFQFGIQGGPIGINLDFFIL